MCTLELKKDNYAIIRRKIIRYILQICTFFDLQISKHYSFENEDDLYRESIDSPVR